MKRFRFRLQKVLEYRESMEQWAQEAYLETRIARLEAEAALQETLRKREACLERPSETLEERRHLETLLLAIDDEEQAKRTVISVLQGEEERALEVWQDKKKELEIIVRLHDQALDAWQTEQSRLEQAALDEWAVLKRGA